MPSSSHWIILNGIRLIVQDLREASRAAEARLGLSGAQIFVLQTLAETPGISVNELGARTYTHQSSVSVVLKRLIQQGLVRAAPARDDRRRRVLTLTAKGRKLAGRAPDAVQVRLIERLNELTAAERSALASGIRKLVEGMGGRSRRAAMFLEDRK